VVIVSAFSREHPEEPAQLPGVRGYLVKPVSSSALVDLLVRVFGPAGGAEGGELAVSRRVHRLDGLRVLLVEDNEINRQIAIELLEGAGARVDVAHNGKEAVDRVFATSAPVHDVVLMDLQMPEMDGYQATAILRADARSARLPIVAMTAHALPEERQRCFDAGMNGHVTKPIDPEHLFETLLAYRIDPHHEARALTAAPARASAAPPPMVEGIETSAGLARVRGNARLYRAMLLQFARDHARARAPSLAEDPAGLARWLHTIKGVAANLGADRLAASAADVEAALQREPGRAPAMLASFSAQLASLVAAIGALDASADDEPGGRAADGDAAGALARLEALLASDDAAAADCFREIKGALAARLSPADVQALEVSVEAYDYADALARVRAASRALDRGPA
jgi:two-component system sensor histidine kinase/response regulator